MTASPIVLTSVPPLAGNSRADGAAEVRDEGGGIVVAVRLGQGCEAGDVGEDERRFDGRVSGMPLTA